MVEIAEFRSLPLRSVNGVLLVASSWIRDSLYTRQAQDTDMGDVLRLVLNTSYPLRPLSILVRGPPLH